MRVDLTPEQQHLAVLCFEFCLLRIKEDHASGVHHYVTRQFTQRRIEELLVLFKEPAK